jgi:hypothetical protein
MLLRGMRQTPLGEGYCSAHYRQSRKGKPLRPLRPFYGKVRPYGPIGPCRFNDLPQVRSGKWDLCIATRSTGGWCPGHAAQWYEKRPLRPLRRRRTGCDFPGCSNRHSCRGYRAAHYQQLRQGKPLRPLNQRKGWYRRKCITVTGRETITVLRISSSGFAAVSHPELESAISWKRRCGSFAVMRLTSCPSVLDSSSGHSAVGS